jgi:hypothetical protein
MGTQLFFRLQISHIASFIQYRKPKSIDLNNPVFSSSQMDIQETRVTVNCPAARCGASNSSKHSPPPRWGRIKVEVMIRSFPPHPNPLPCLRPARRAYAQQAPGEKEKVEVEDHSTRQIRPLRYSPSGWLRLMG